MEEQTPLMKQYSEIKAKAGDALLFFRMGDFYELFGEDAVTASRILEITLTSRDRNKANPMPMAGVPHHSAGGYIQRLLKSGKKVAIGEQMEDPSAAKGIVRRDLVRIFTPAVQFDLEGSEASYLATALQDEKSGQWLLACLDSSTGEALVSEALSSVRLLDECLQRPIRHFLRIGNALPVDVVASFGSQTLLEDLPSNFFSRTQAHETLQRHYGVQSLDAFVSDPTAAHAIGLLVHYVNRTQKQDVLAHLRPPAPLNRPRTLTLGPRTALHLDLFPGADAQPNLFQLINKTRSALGARQLRRWLAEPLKAVSEIQQRQEAVRALSTPATSGAAAAQKISARLTELYDLERISGRLTTGLANPRDTLALGQSLAILPRIAEVLSTVPGSALLSELTQATRSASARLAHLGERILRTQRPDAPLTVRDGGIFAHGTTPELDHLLTLTEDGQRFLIELEAREREATSISSLKVRYNRVFGYFIEVTQAHLKNVPVHYQRKQTTVGAERFFTEELKKFEEEIVTASSKQKALEQQLFGELIAAIQKEISAIMSAARSLGELDSLLSMASLTENPGWIFPTIDESIDIDIEAGRHPVLDTGSFVPNDLRLSGDSRRTLLITGPNMGGKSTVMRQLALIVILGQMGAPVPASRARWGAVSKLHTRIGAHDAIARGQSTFMVEMTELAHILNHADERSLIILDEIGRGTSTFDGMSVAWAALEWICSRVRARTLFATHYHELTHLEGTLPGLSNAHMAVDSSTRTSSTGSADSLRFLYKLNEGPTNESFGIHVARMAGLPKPVIERAWQVLESLESQQGAKTGLAGNTSQLSFFGNFSGSFSEPASQSPAPPVEAPTLEAPAPHKSHHPVLESLAELDINSLTPLEALNLLSRLHAEAREHCQQ